MLLVGAGLLGRSFLRLLEVNPGFQPESAVAMSISQPDPEEPADRRGSRNCSHYASAWADAGVMRLANHGLPISAARTALSSWKKRENGGTLANERKFARFGGQRARMRIRARAPAIRSHGVQLIRDGLPHPTARRAALALIHNARPSPGPQDPTGALHSAGWMAICMLHSIGWWGCAGRKGTRRRAMVCDYFSARASLVVRIVLGHATGSLSRDSAGCTRVNLKCADFGRLKRWSLRRSTTGASA